MATRRIAPILAAGVFLLAPATLTAQDARATAAAKRMFDARAASTQTAAELKRSYRQSDADVVKILHAVGYRPDAVARAAAETLRADAPTAAGLMAGAGLDAPAIAAGLARGARVTGLSALRAMDRARIRGTASAPVYRAAQVDPDELTTYLHGRGTSADRTARTLTEVHRLGGDKVAAPLLKRYEPIDVARTLDTDFRLAPDLIRTSLKDGGVDQVVVGDIMDELGYGGPAAPTLGRWFIRDYELGAAPGSVIENAQIVNRNAVNPAPSAVDGVVWIDGENIDHPETQVFGATLGGTPIPGQIRSRQEVGFYDRLEVYFPSFPAPGFRVVTPGGTIEVGEEAWPAGYSAIELSLFEEALEGLSVSVDGDVEVVFGSMIITGPLTETRENGLEVSVIDLNSDGFEVSTEAEPSGAALLLTIPFEEEGREFRGEFFGYTWCWKCLTRTIPKADCAVLTLNCILDYLGQSMDQLGECTDLSNWHETQVEDTDGLDFTGDLTNTSLTVRMAFHVDGQGLGATGTTYNFDTSVSLAVLDDDLDLNAIDDLVRGRVSSRLSQAMTDIDLSESLVASLQQYGDALGWGRWRSLRRMADGRLFVSFGGS